MTSRGPISHSPSVYFHFFGRLEEEIDNGKSHSSRLIGLIEFTTVGQTVQLEKMEGTVMIGTDILERRQTNARESDPN